MSLILIVGGAIFLYLLWYRPEVVAILLFTLMIANINIDLPGMPLNSRALITLALFGRILMDKSTKAKYPSFASIPIVAMLLIFLVYILLISYYNDLFTMDLLKGNISIAISVYCVYHFFFVDYKSDRIKIAIILSGIICFSDLAYTYINFGSFPVRRLSAFFSGESVEEVDPNAIFTATVNHNFYGQICGMAFVYVFNEVVRNIKASKYLIFLLPIMFLGVLMSTSRSSLLAIVIVVLFIILNSIQFKEQRRKIYKIASFSIGAIFVGGLLFSTIGMYFKLDSKFVDEVVFRLAEEPIAMFQRALGQNYNIQNLGSMDWREEASANAYAAYMNLDFTDQLFGIGTGGFISRNMGQGLNPHNGILLVLIQVGLVGFLIYIILIFSAIWQCIRLKNISPSLSVLLFIIIYGIGQNDELTSSTTFLFVYSMVAENLYIIMEKKNRFQVMRSVKMAYKRIS